VTVILAIHQTEPNPYAVTGCGIAYTVRLKMNTRIRGRGLRTVHKFILGYLALRSGRVDQH
jgi:hypothetical protein